MTKLAKARTYDTLSDAELMQVLQDGDMSALGELYQRFSGLIGSAIVATASSLSRQEVEDLCQDVFIAISQSAKKYSETGKLKSWLYSIAVRTARKHTRTVRVRQRLLRTVFGQPVAIARGRSTPGRQTMAKLDLERAFYGLSKKQRELLILFEYQGLSGEEIAELLDMKLNTVWSHLRRARLTVTANLGDIESRLG